MNDIQAKENAYTVATTAVQKQNENLKNAHDQLVQAQNFYLQSVIHAAVLSEKSKRKKDALTNLIVWGCFVVLSLILLLINILVGVIFILIGGIIVFVFSAQGSDERKENYNKRKDFFTKYSYAIPANERLKWKNSAPVYTGSNVAQTAGWKCPKCSTVNANSSNYCVSCGTKKP